MFDCFRASKCHFKAAKLDILREFEFSLKFHILKSIHEVSKLVLVHTHKTKCMQPLIRKSTTECCE